MGKWEMVRLGELTKIRTGKLDANASDEKGKYPFFTCAINPLRIDSYSYDCECVLVAGNGDLNVKYYQGKFDAYQRTYIIESISSDKLYVPYLFQFLQKYITVLRTQTSGGVIQYIRLNSLTDAKLPLPPLDEQKRIAQNLDLASEIVKGYKEQLAELDKLVQSVFYEMFGDIGANCKMWDITPFSYCAKIDTRMTTDFAKYADYPHIGIDSIEKNTGNIISCVLVKDSDLKSGKYLFDDRHLIYSKIRPNLNKVAKPNFEGICSADAYPLLPTKQCNREYLAMVLRSDSFLDYILAFSNRTNIPKVNKSQLESFSLPLPPIDIQTRFASIVTEIEAQKAQVQTALEQAQNLFNSLMQEYFE